MDINLMAEFARTASPAALVQQEHEAYVTPLPDADNPSVITHEKTSDTAAESLQDVPDSAEYFVDETFDENEALFSDIDIEDDTENDEDKETDFESTEDESDPVNFDEDSDTDLSDIDDTKDIETSSTIASSRDLLGLTHDENVIEEGSLLLKAANINKIYNQGGDKLHVLNNVDLRLYSGEITALVGQSGSGKSTLLHILGLLDAPSSGQLFMGNRDISKLKDRERTQLRNEHIGFVYQFHHLLPEFTAIENVALPLIIAGKKPDYAKDKAAIFLEHLGLEHRMKHRPATLSGGEQQRVAIARALINDPYLLFADEPTGNLDPETSEEVFALLLDLVHSRGISALIATHNIDLAHQMDRILEVKSGRILPY